MAELYCVNISELNPKECRILSALRKEKAASYSLDKDKKLCLAAGIAFDRGLRHYGLEERGVTLAYGEYGKPYIEGRPEVKFNLSHSGDMAIAVFSSKEVGCDIEKRGRYNEMILNRCFSEEEKCFVNQSEDKDLAFTRIWVGKESFLKAIGIGIAADFRKVAVCVDENGISLKQKLDPRRWNIKERVFDDYVLAICEEE